MSIFLCLSDRYREALDTFDPFRGEWLLRILDPWWHAKGDGKPQWLRFILPIPILFGPLLLFSLIPSPTFRSDLPGSNDMLADVGVSSMLVWLVGALLLIPIGRRMIGALIDELARFGIVGTKARDFNTLTAPKGRLLTVLDACTRVAGPHGLFLFCAIEVITLGAYYNQLAGGNPAWQHSSVSPGTLLSLLRVGKLQPNLAGIWFFLLFSPVVIYFIVLAARLFVVLACLCDDLSRQEDLLIDPPHPDGVGGLQPVGQVMLFFSLFTFLVGICIAGITANIVIRNTPWTVAATPVVTSSTSLTSHSIKASPCIEPARRVFDTGVTQGLPVSQVDRKGNPESMGTSRTILELFAWWLPYLFVGTLLFFAPLLPLRKRMGEAKRQYLVTAQTLHLHAKRIHDSQLAQVQFSPDSLQGLVALDELMEKAAAMAVWPYDRRTFVRYAGLLLTPLAPLVADKLLPLLNAIRARLGL